jgi:tRNA threonylcarbamoyladenosine biosynthesis protein TsaE
VNKYKITSTSQEHTISIGNTIGKWVTGGDVVLLYGPFGAGKTVLTQGIAASLNITDPIRSPSFTLMSSYDGDITLTHWDLYRLNKIEEVWDLGIQDQFNDETVCVIEWAERGDALFPEDSIKVLMDHGEDSEKRTFEFELDSSNFRHIELWDALAQIK